MWIVTLVVNDRLRENFSVCNTGVIAFEVCGRSSPWLSRNNNNTNDGDEGFYCPSGNTCCPMTIHRECSGGSNSEGKSCDYDSWGCVASDMGAKNATCCLEDGDENTGCPSGYECRRRESESNVDIVYDCLRSPINKGSDDDDDGDPLMRVLPRYRLCSAEESNRKLYGLPVQVPPPPFHDFQGSEGNQSINTNLNAATSKLAYYSNLGPIESEAIYQHKNDDDYDDNLQLLSGVEMVLVIVHGANRNGDDYFCSAKATIDLQNRYSSSIDNKRPAVLVIAPVFLSSSSSLLDNTTGKKEMLNGNNASSFLYWNDANDKDGTWRYGNDATGPAAVSSFDAMDALITTLKSSAKLPNLRKIVVAGHSSGGQFVQRWGLLTPPEVWPTLASPSAGSITMHTVVANPSSYSYLTPLRFFDEDKSIDSSAKTTRLLRKNQTDERNSQDSLWKVPPKKDCPGYNQWEWGLEDGGQLDVPYRKRAFSRESRSGVIDRYLRHRSVVYLIGNLDRCSKSERKTKVKQHINDQGHDENCDSHGLETTCADELQGNNRYERNARYWASLELVAVSFIDQIAFSEGGAEKASVLPHMHNRVVVPDVGHDHSMMFQSKEGIAAIYSYN